MSAVDPVCGTKVNEGHAGARTEYARRMYFFCKLGCKAEFERNPEHYVDELDARFIRGGSLAPTTTIRPAADRCAGSRNQP